MFSKYSGKVTCVSLCIGGNDRKWQFKSSNTYAREGGCTVDLKLGQDIWQILLDTEKTKRGLERLKRDHAAWKRECQEKDLVWLTEQAMRLENDLSLILSDSMSLGRGYCEDSRQDVSQDLHQVFVVLDALFRDLKKARLELSRAYINPNALKYLEIDWARFGKKIGKLQEHLHNGDKGLEVF